MPRKKRSRGGNRDNEQNDGHRRLPSRIPDSPGYVTWGERPFGRTRGGPASVPTGVSSEIDFSLQDHGGSTECSPVSSGQSSLSLSPTRATSSTRGHRQRRSGGHNELAVGEPTSSVTPSSERGGSWSPSTVASSAGPSGTSPLRERFSPSRLEYAPNAPQGSPTRPQHSFADQQAVPSHHHSPAARPQHRHRYQPYPGPAPTRQSVVAPQPRVPLASSSSSVPGVSAVGLYPAPEVNVPPAYGYTEPVTDDAQQWPQSDPAFNTYGSLPALDANLSHLNYFAPPTEQHTSHIYQSIPQQIPFHTQHVPDSSSQYAPFPAQSSANPFGYYGSEAQNRNTAYDNAAMQYPQHAQNAPFVYGSAEQPQTSSMQYPSYQWTTGPPNSVASTSQMGRAHGAPLAHIPMSRSCRSDTTLNLEQPSHRFPDTRRSPSTHSAAGHDHSRCFFRSKYVSL
ncbi:uncharacterized protein B0H18DRAFT_994236 [Fomitopsis serialis]|uniref:uncharacterized protein n=1 Tax=Fomitopsis serialis TaxID=139415 RepID=UPI002008A6EE|nr:uncharacterized protein B0H18DRAFT_994236 [Neoantrodia serialis]KAH9930293.1 hypothetical protein B0H18DRAFT_994236 [Neoantrodia serialis]